MSCSLPTLVYTILTKLHHCTYDKKVRVKSHDFTFWSTFPQSLLWNGHLIFFVYNFILMTYRWLEILQYSLKPNYFCLRISDLEVIYICIFRGHHNLNIVELMLIQFSMKAEWKQVFQILQHLTLYEVHTISFQTFVHTWNSSPLRSNLLQLQCTYFTVPTTSGRPHGSYLVWARQWPSSQPLSSPQLMSHNDSLWA